MPDDREQIAKDTGMWIDDHIPSRFVTAASYDAWREGLNVIGDQIGVKRSYGWGNSSTLDVRELVRQGADPDQIKALFIMLFDVT